MAFVVITIKLHDLFCLDNFNIGMFFPEKGSIRNNLSTSEVGVRLPYTLPSQHSTLWDYNGYVVVFLSTEQEKTFTFSWRISSSGRLKVMLVVFRRTKEHMVHQFLKMLLQYVVAPKAYLKWQKMEDLWLRSQVQAPHHAKRNPIFKWRRVEGRAHYPPSLEDCDWSKGRVTCGFLGYKK
ncbi:hypothetical protein H5410_029462 [Solanum commersonii]|uniref:Uncharacterized protein n=1 Tax=Solanum commersonii TaxID=4109 RepID=A0A9J5Z5P9_SOLCO|nr:hypothetical protein H5410_029462 [Solanum commersonii]